MRHTKVHAKRDTNHQNNAANVDTFSITPPPPPPPPPR